MKIIHIELWMLIISFYLSYVKYTMFLISDVVIHLLFILNVKT